MKARTIAIAVMLSALLSVVIASLWGAPPLARLSFAQGHVERDQRTKEGQWVSAQQGDALLLGDGLRTGDKSQARLSLARGTVLQVDENTTMRLLSSAPGQESFRIVQGSAEIEAGEAELSIETSAGTVRVARKGRISLRESKADTWVRVDMGRAELGWKKASPLLAGDQSNTPHALTEASAVPATVLELKLASSPRMSADKDGASAYVTGTDVRAQKLGQRSLSPLAEGEQLLPIGTRVLVEADSSLRLAQGEGGQLMTSGRAELVVGDGRDVATRVISGKLRATAGRVPVQIEVPGGRLTLLVDEHGGSEATLSVSRQDTQVSVEAGAITLRENGSERTLKAGAQGQLKASTASTEVVGEVPALADASLRLGLSTQVHDPNPPSAITFALGAACGGQPALLEQNGPMGYVVRATGQQQLLAWFPLGSTNYRVRCQSVSGSSGKIVATGRIGVQRDQAERQVTKRAPELEVELDGRKYTAVYQTLLPRVTAHLPRAAPSQATLRVSSGAITRSFPVAQGQLILESGQLKEGEHTLSLEGAAGEKPTTLVIRFDNDAPAAYVEGASGMKRAPDGSVTLRGGALPGSEVTVDGKRLTLDKESRFEEKLMLPPGARGFGLSIKHPRAGSHYYIRRVEGGAPP